MTPAIALVALASLTSQMQGAFPQAHYVPRYSESDRAPAAKNALGLSTPPTLGPPTSLTPNAPFADDGAHLSFWKTSFVLGTADGGEAGANFWNIRVGGHINVGYVAKKGEPVLFDCRLYSAEGVSVKLYAGRIAQEADKDLRDGHLFFLAPAFAAGTEVSLEIWPRPADAEMGFLGCDIEAVR